MTTGLHRARAARAARRCVDAALCPAMVAGEADLPVAIVDALRHVLYPPPDRERVALCLALFPADFWDEVEMAVGGTMSPREALHDLAIALVRGHPAMPDGLAQETGRQRTARRAELAPWFHRAAGGIARDPESGDITVGEILEQMGVAVPSPAAGSGAPAFSAFDVPLTAMLQHVGDGLRDDSLPGASPIDLGPLERSMEAKLGGPDLRERALVRRLVCWFSGLGAHVPDRLLPDILAAFDLNPLRAASAAQSARRWLASTQ